MKKYLFLSMLLSLVTLTPYLQGVEPKNFPAQISFESNGKTYKLDKTGETTRKKYMIKVYDVASYLENGTVTNKANAFDEILQDNKAKQLTLYWLHDVDVAKMHEGYEESFRKVLPGDQYNQFKQEREKYMSFFDHETKVGDVEVIRWIPGGTIEVLFNGKSAGTVTNPQFAKALYSMWFGPTTSVKREDLISLIK
jgi:hypothetical protein